MPQCLSSAKKEGSGWLHKQPDSSWPIITNNTPRDWSLITGRGALKWENSGSQTFCAPPQDRVKLVVPPLLRLDYGGFGGIW